LIKKLKILLFDIKNEEKICKSLRKALRRNQIRISRVAKKKKIKISHLCTEKEVRYEVCPGNPRYAL
jgi:aspartokinase